MIASPIVASSHDELLEAQRRESQLEYANLSLLQQLQASETMHLAARTEAEELRKERRDSIGTAQRRSRDQVQLAAARLELKSVSEQLVRIQSMLT